MSQRRKPGWVRWFHADWRSSARVASMTFEERGFYRELLDYQAEVGPFAIDDPGELARQLRGERADIERLWPRVADCFERVGGLVRNAKLEEERERGIARSQAGQNAVAARERRRSTDATTDASTDRTTRARSPTPTPTPTPEQKPEGVQEDLDPAGAAAPAASGPVQGSLLEGSQSQPPPSASKNGSPKPRKAKTPRKSRAKDPVNADFAAWWEERWLEQRGKPWRWSAKQRTAVDGVRGLAQGDLGEMVARAENMLGSDDAWIVQRASPALLQSQWNEWAVVVRRRRPGDWINDPDLEITS